MSDNISFTILNGEFMSGAEGPIATIKGSTKYSKVWFYLCAPLLFGFIFMFYSEPSQRNFAAIIFLSIATYINFREFGQSKNIEVYVDKFMIISNGIEIEYEQIEKIFDVGDYWGPVYQITFQMKSKRYFWRSGIALHFSRSLIVFFKQDDGLPLLEAVRQEMASRESNKDN